MGMFLRSLEIYASGFAYC